MKVPEPEELCGCFASPVNEWLDRCGNVVESRPLAEMWGEPQEPGEVTRRATSDAESFLDHPTAVSWRIVCPQCRQVFASFDNFPFKRPGDQ